MVYCVSCRSTGKVAFPNNDLEALKGVQDVQTRRESEAECRRVAFLNHFRKVFAGDIARSPHNPNICVFFFDADGDGIEEAFGTTGIEPHAPASIWCIWRYRDGIWSRVDGVEYHYNAIFAHAYDFYYRDDVEEEPRLFLRESSIGTPALHIYTRFAKEYSYFTGFGKEEYETLWTKGILKPIESHWYDENNQIIATIKGNDEPIVKWEGLIIAE